MPCNRRRATLESGPKIDLAILIPPEAGKPGANISCILTYAAGETIAVDLKLREYGGRLELSSQGRQQTKARRYEWIGSTVTVLVDPVAVPRAVSVRPATN